MLFSQRAHKKKKEKRKKNELGVNEVKKNAISLSQRGKKLPFYQPFRVLPNENMKFTKS